MSSVLPASIGLIRAEALRHSEHRDDPNQPRLPFVTIARQVGAGGEKLAYQLADRLNRGEPGPTPWRAYDRELVEKIASDHQLSQTLIDLLEDTSHGWLQQIFEGLNFSRPSTDALTHRVIQTVRGLAEGGHAIMVGRGGVFITQGMPQGVHIYLVAPLDYRIETCARRYDLTQAEAAQRVKEIDQNRAKFYARNFPQCHYGPAAFHLTLNTARVPLDTILQMVLSLVSEKQNAEPVKGQTVLS